MSDDVQAADVVLGQIGTHQEPICCLSCGKSARACGKGGAFCCRDCAGTPGAHGTSFLTHYPPAPTDPKGADRG